MVKASPAYLRLYKILKQKLIDGEYPVGKMLPTEAELCEQYKMSRTTVRRAVEMLAREDYICAKQGRGTEVLDFRTRQSLNTVTSINETLRQKGHDVSSKSFYIDAIDATERLAADLQIPTGAPLYRVQRIQMADEKPIAIMKNYIPQALVPDFRSAAPFPSLYLYLGSQYNININRAHDRISARMADFTDAEMLQVPIGTALIAFARVCYQVDLPVCVDHLSIVGDRYEFELFLSGRNPYNQA